MPLATNDSWDNGAIPPPPFRCSPPPLGSFVGMAVVLSVVSVCVATARLLARAGSACEAKWAGTASTSDRDIPRKVRFASLHQRGLLRDGDQNLREALVQGAKQVVSVRLPPRVRKSEISPF